MKEIVTKTGFTITESWCRKCSKMLPATDFFQCTDLGELDANGLGSICKKCSNEHFDKIYKETGSLEKAIHRCCIDFNLKFNQDAIESLKTHINTQIENGTNHSPILSTYRAKLVSKNKSMDKSIAEKMTYEDTTTIFLSPLVEKEGEVISDELKNFWGDSFDYKDIQFLEREYANAKTTHRADTFAEVTLLKEVIYKMLEIKHSREAGRSTDTAVKGLQELMKNLAISPNAVNASANGGKSLDSFGLWIQEIEKEEPAQWLKGDGKKFEMYRDVSNVDDYFQKYFVRPLKNFITSSRDFNIGTESDEELDDVFTEIAASESED